MPSRIQASASSYLGRQGVSFWTSNALSMSRCASCSNSQCFRILATRAVLALITQIKLTCILFCPGSSGQTRPAPPSPSKWESVHPSIPRQKLKGTTKVSRKLTAKNSKRYGGESGDCNHVDDSDADVTGECYATLCARLLLQ